MRCFMMIGAWTALLIVTLTMGRVHGEVQQMAELHPVLVPAPGFYLKAPSSGEPLITLEFFIDLICPASRYAWGPALELSQHYSPDNVAVRVYMYPLPYHRNAMLASQGLLLLRHKMPAMAQDYIGMVLDNLEEFTTFATANQTENQVLEQLANYTEQLTGLPLSDILTDIHDYNRAVRNEWKLGANRGVAGTPTIFVNGIEVYFTDVTIEGLKSMLDRHLEGAARNVGSTSGSSSLPPDEKSGSSATSSSASVLKFW